MILFCGKQLGFVTNNAAEASGMAWAIKEALHLLYHIVDELTLGRAISTSPTS